MLPYVSTTVYGSGSQRATALLMARCQRSTFSPFSKGTIRMRIFASKMAFARALPASSLRLAVVCHRDMLVAFTRFMHGIPDPVVWLSMSVAGGTFVVECGVALYART